MLCPCCGRYLQKNTVCNYCGHSIKNENENGKEPKNNKVKKKRTHYVITLFLIAVITLSLFHFLQYETESADKLVRAAEKEVEKGSELLQKAEHELHTLREIQLEAKDRISSERDYISQSREKIHSILSHLDAAEPAFERAEAFLEKTEQLRLPGRYRQHVEVEKEIVQKYTEYCELVRTLCNNFTVYYTFSEYYLTGEQLFINLMGDMDRGNDNLEREDYTFACAAYDSALIQLKEAHTAYTTALNLIDLPYIHDLLSNLDYLERALYSLSEAAHQMELENVEHAAFLAALGEKEIESMTELDKLQLKTHITEWYTTNITDIFTKIDTLTTEIEALTQDVMLS